MVVHRRSRHINAVHNESLPCNSGSDTNLVPFFWSSKGYGVFVNHPGEVELEIGSEKRSRIGISVPGEQLEIFMIYGPTPKEVRSICRHNTVSVSTRPIDLTLFSLLDLTPLHLVDRTA